MERVALERLLKLERVWGQPSIGLVLANGHFTGECLSADDIAAKTGLTRQTVYNHLKRLVPVERAVRTRSGRTSVYCATEQWALWTRQIVQDWVNDTHSPPPPE